MATWNPAATTFSHASDAGFQQWATELLDALTNGAFASSGTIYTNLSQTADTGQLASATLATAVRPAVNTALGYICLAFNDTQASTAPVAIKIEVGTGSTTTSGGVWVTIGNGFDGAGGVINATLARTQYNLAPASTTTNYSTYCSCVDGGLNLIFKNTGGPSGSSGFLFLINRGSDLSTGAPDADSLHYAIASTNVQPSFRNVSTAGTGTVGNTNTVSCNIPASITSSLVGGIAQVFKHYVAAPGCLVRPVRNLLCAVASECPSGTTITASPIASGDSHTYLSLALGGAQYPISNNYSGFNLLIVWE
jgi:hypothetical protein